MYIPSNALGLDLRIAVFMLWYHTPEHWCMNAAELKLAILKDDIKHMHTRADRTVYRAGRTLIRIRGN